ncbi:putative invertase inhibitor [Trifolium repens]|jgi:pectinesterase inhibitor-like protein|nr:putative invertase inhibitor [Trifolium repens]
MTKLFSVLVICVIIFAQQTTAEEIKENPEIKKVCSFAPATNRDLCIEVLKSDPKSTNADLTDLAIIALRVAAKNASAMLTDVKMLIDDADLDPEIQQGLADCKETILDAESQLEDTIAALLIESDADAQTWLKAALAAITTCDDSIPGNDDVLSVKSKTFRNLCNIVVVITKALPNNRASTILPI